MVWSAWLWQVLKICKHLCCAPTENGNSRIWSNRVIFPLFGLVSSFHLNSSVNKQTNKANNNMRRTNKSNIKTPTFDNFLFKKIFDLSHEIIKGTRLYPNEMTFCWSVCLDCSLQHLFSWLVWYYLDTWTVPSDWWKYHSMQHMMRDSHATWQKGRLLFVICHEPKKCETPL